MHTVTFDAGEGSLPAGAETTVTVEDGDKLTALPTPIAPEGFTFSGWYDGDALFEAGTAVKSSLTLTAKYTADDDAGGTEDAPVNICFYPTSAKLSAGSTLYLTVQNAEDGTDLTDDCTFTVSEGADVVSLTGSIITALKEGTVKVTASYPYTNAAGETVTVTCEPMTLTVVASYRYVTFDAGEGTLPEGTENPAAVLYGEKLTALPTPTAPEGTYFVGWMLNNTLFTPDTPVTKNVTLTAWYATETPSSDFIIRNNELLDYQGDAAEIVVPYGVTKIRTDAFKGNDTITTVVLPATVTAIEANAFSNCYNLTSINLPEGITTIESNTFYYCVKLERISFPSTLTSIGSDAFQYCYALTSVTFPSTLKTIDSSAFDGCPLEGSLVFPAALTSIGYNAFEDNRLTSLTFNSAPSIGSNAFYTTYPSGTAAENVVNANMTVTCTTMTPPKLEAANSLFYYSHNGSQTRRRITLCLPEGATAAYEADACWCYAHSFSTLPADDFLISHGELISYTGTATDVVIPDGVTTIAKTAFRGKTAITSVTLPASVRTIAAEAFSGCTSLTTMDMSASDIKVIDYKTFYNCSALTTVKFSDSLTSIGSSAFCGCPLEGSLTFPASLTSIGGSAFYGNHLTTLTFNSAPTVGSYAFYSTYASGETVVNKQITVYCNTATPPALYHSDSLFSYYVSTIYYSRTITLYVPEGAEEAYAADNVWGNAYINPQIEGDFLITSDGVLCGYTGTASIVVIPAKVTKIDEDTFKNCTTLTSLDLSAATALTSIDSDTFRGCSALTSVVLGNSLASIDDYAFYGCPLEGSLTFPASLTSIGNRSFYGNRLTTLTFNSAPTVDSSAFRSTYASGETVVNKQMTVYCNTATPPALYNSDSLFAYVSNGYGSSRTITLYVPEGAVDTYKADTYWKKASTIEAYDFN